MIKTKAGITIMMVLTLMSCRENGFTSWESSDIHYTIHHKNDLLLRSLNTDGQGVQKLQLFTSDGKLVEEQKMHNNPFRIESWTADAISVKYLISDLQLFLPWFEKNIGNEPARLGSFNIRYSYEEVMGSSALTEYKSDSLSFREEAYVVDLFDQQERIASVPLDSLSIYREQLIRVRKSESGILTGSRYIIERRLAKQLLEAIITDKK